MTYISLFSGAGVGCYGFSKEDFDCIASVEIIKRRLNVQKHNNKCLYENGYIADDIAKEQTKEKILAEIDFWKNRHNLREVDVILATPPCQGMSVANHKKKNERARNSLVVESIQLVDRIRPKIFVFENVRAFLTTECTDLDGENKSIREAIEINLGGKYNIHYQALNFKDYGNPSSRTRTLVIGARKDIQEITPLDLLPKPQKFVTIRDVIGNLPAFKTMGEISKNDIYHNFRPYAEHMLEWIKNTKEGQSAFDNTDPQNRPHRIVGGKVVFNEKKNGDKYTRCYWDRTPPCIHTRNDIFASQSTIHPSDNRVFSIRELMRLMSIPDDFKWTNIPEKELNTMPDVDKKKFLKKEEINIRQSIGEAVPTIIFCQIAQNIKSLFDESKLDEKKVKKLIQEHNLTDRINLKNFLKKNLRVYNYWELAKITELSNAARLKHAAYYTRQDICFTVIKDLPDASQYEKLKILEPSVGAGNFLPLLIQKYKTVNQVDIDLIDIDKEAVDILKILVSKLIIPANIRINFVNADFLLYGETDLFGQYKRYDIVVGNPPFGSIIKDPELLIAYKKNRYNSQTNNLFSFFLEKCLQLSDVVGFIIPKSFLSSPEFNKTRELVSNFAVKKIIDYGEEAFRDVKIETIGIIINTTERYNQTLIESYIKNRIELKNQEYICPKDFPYWLVYRNDFFDTIAKKLRFNIFSAFRDRQITKKITKTKGEIRVLKSRNIADNKIVNIPEYDTYIDDVERLVVSRFLNKTESVLVPNLTYYPRACFLPENTVVDGSVAILTPRDEKMNITEKDLNYFNTEEFSEFYRIARNYGTRSLNIDSNSVFFLGVKR